MTTSELHQTPEDVAVPRDDDMRLWSVTTLIGVLDKPGLVYWSASMTAQAAIREQNAWLSRLEHEGEDSAIDYLTGARFRKPPGQTRSTTDLGTAVHAAIEEYTLTGVRPVVDEELAPYLEQFDKWANQFQPEYIATEVTVLHPDYGYAGTSDGFMVIQGSRAIADYKTSAKSFDKKGNPTHPYPTVGLQLAAYRFAKHAAIWRPRRFESFRRRYYLASPEELAMAVPVPEVDGGLAIHITPSHCTAYPVRCDEEVFRAFLYIIEAARWEFELSKTVIGNPLEPAA